MDILVTYDVNTTSPDGRRRLRTVANACKGFGQRVQLSVFECRISSAQLEALEARLAGIIKPDEDSLRIYILPGSRESGVRVHGLDHYMDFDDPLIL
jgi:CRISPR-associated protein Cas2